MALENHQENQASSRVASSCCPSEETAAETHASCPPATAARPDYFMYFCASMVTVFYLLGWTEVDWLVGPAAELAATVFELVNRMWWGMALGVVFVGALGTVPRELVMGVLGTDSGLRGLLRATAGGLLLDLCSHGILMVGMKLYERGASMGQVIAFLVASPWNSLSLTIILVALIGLTWTIVFVLLSLVVALISGLVFEQLTARGSLPVNPYRAESSVQSLGELWLEYRRDLEPSAGGAIKLLQDGLLGSRVVFRWVLFGILLAGLVRAGMDDALFVGLFGASLMGLGMTLLVATVLEVCSEGATPLAADFMTRASAPGNSFTFLMAGVATDYTEIMSLRETTGSWKVALFLPLITVPQIVLLGIILNQFSV